MKEKNKTITESIDLQGLIDKEALKKFAEDGLCDLWEIFGRMSYEESINPTVIDLFNGVASTLGIVRRILA